MSAHTERESRSVKVPLFSTKNLLFTVVSLDQFSYMSKFDHFRRLNLELYIKRYNTWGNLVEVKYADIKFGANQKVRFASSIPELIVVKS